VTIRIPQGISEAIMASPLPFAPRPLRVLDPRGMIWTTGADASYRLVQHDLGGDTLRMVERAYRPVPVSDAERAVMLERFQGSGLDPDKVPDVHPPFEDVEVAESGHLWAWRHAGPERMAWDVFDPEGRYLGEVGLPFTTGRFLLRALTEDALYGVWMDELDVPRVVRLQVVKGQR
jgi:hypothetical protein